MITNPAYKSIPDFDTAGGGSTIVAPPVTPYSNGYIYNQILPAEHANYFFNGLTVNSNLATTALGSVVTELTNLLAGASLTPVPATTNQVLTSVTTLIGYHNAQTGSSVHGATSSPTASMIVTRDVSGRAQFANPSAAQDAVTKNYFEGYIDQAVKTTSNSTFNQLLIVSSTESDLLFFNGSTRKGYIQGVSGGLILQSESSAGVSAPLILQPSGSSNVRVGAGADTGKTLQVNGSIFCATGINLPSDVAIAFNSGSSQFYRNSTRLGLQFNGTGGSDTMLLRENGNLLIGTITDNGSLLQVSGDISSSGSVFSNSLKLSTAGKTSSVNLFSGSGSLGITVLIPKGIFIFTNMSGIVFYGLDYTGTWVDIGAAIMAASMFSKTLFSDGGNYKFTVSSSGTYNLSGIKYV